MAEFTKQAMKQVFRELLMEKSLSEISVREITEKCGVNRNTFYYHFRDIPALVEEIMMEQADALLMMHPTMNSMEECLYAILDWARDNQEIVMHIYNSLSRTVFEKYLFEVCYILAENFWNNTLALRSKEKTPQNRRIVIDCYASVCFGLAMRWLSNGMDDRQARRDVPELCRVLRLERP